VWKDKKEFPEKQLNHDVVKNVAIFININEYWLRN